MQSLLASLINIVVLGFFGVMTIDFVIGLFVMMQKVKVETQPMQLLVKPQSTLETVAQELPEVAVVPVESDEATIQYLEMTGCSLNDFDSIAEARKFLDENAPWTIETQPKQTVETQAILLDPWEDEAETAKKDTRKQSPRAEEKLTFESVCADFAKQGLTLQRYSGGRYKYRLANSHGSPCRFKKLQDALDWLAASKQPMTTV